jgi:hypothetical protein
MRTTPILFILVLSLLFIPTSSCGKGPELGQFAPYVWRFQGEAAARGVPAPDDDITVVGLTDAGMKPYRDELGPRVIGVCEIPAKIVDISLSYWNQASETEREMLIFHELGHCILGRPHNIQRNVFTGIPMSIMFPDMIIPLQVYQKYRSLFLNELFFSK